MPNSTSIIENCAKQMCLSMIQMLHCEYDREFQAVDSNNSYQQTFQQRIQVQMFATYINKKDHNVCSIEDLNHEIQKDELLLSNQNKNETIVEEDEDELFELYITPYSEKDAKAVKNKDLSMYEDTTIIKGSQREEAIFQTKCQEYEEELKRLKRIIVKKNKVIGDLTEQLRLYYQQPKKTHKNKKFIFLQNHSQQCQHARHKENECQNSKCKVELSFYQKNNLQLYEQMASYKVKSENMEKQLGLLAQDLQKNHEKAQKLQNQNKILKKQNVELLKSTKKYLSQSTKQIKIMNKMRQVLAEKLSLKEMNLQLPEYNSKSISLAQSKIRTERQKIAKKVPEKQDVDKWSKSLQKYAGRQKNSKQRSASHDLNKR